VLGFEASGMVEAAGADVDDVQPGDPVAVFLPGLGGYAEQVLAAYWVRKPESVSWADAAAFPASAEAAARVLDQLGLTAGETLLLLGGAGSVGTIATQLAVARGASVIAAVRPDDFAAAEKLGAIPVAYGDGLAGRVRAQADRVDAVMDAAGRGGLQDALALAGGPQRVITLSDPHAADVGVRLSGPRPERIRPELEAVMPMLASGALALRPRITAPLGDVAQIHHRLESGDIHEKVVLTI
jgi:NADPH:quinone reductase-like Zn-dependent oxidoreductase